MKELEKDTIDAVASDLPSDYDDGQWDDDTVDAIMDGSFLDLDDD